MAITPSVGTVSGAASGGSSTLSTPAQTVIAGAAAYVQVAMYGTSLGNPTSITDSQGGVYNLLQSGHSGSVYLWVYRRAGPLASSASFTVTVTPASSTVPIEVVSIEVLSGGGADVVSTFHSGTGTSETSSVVTAYDTVLFLGADNSGGFSSWGAGQSGISGYPSPPTNVTAWGSYQSLVSPGTANSTRTISSSKAWAAICLAITPQVTWSEIAGKPFVTVSPLGTVGGATIANNGADYGPDTAATNTSGIQEAINSLTSGGRILLAPGTYSLGTTSVILPIGVAISLESFSPDEVAGGSGTAPPTACLNYTGSGFAIDSSNTSLTPNYTGSLTTPAPVGYIDGIMVYSPNGNGVRINNVVYQIGRLSVYGTNSTGNATGLQLSPISNGPEVTIRFLRVIGFKTEIILAQDHIDIGHINTALCTTGGTVIQWGNGGSNRGPLGLAIQYWHHFGGAGSGLVPSFIFDYGTTGEQAHSGFIGSLFLEVPSGVPSNSIVRSSCGYGSNLVIANLDYGNGGAVYGFGIGTLPSGSALLETLGGVPHGYANAVPGVNVLNVDNITPMGFKFGTSGLTPAVPSPSPGSYQNAFCRPVLIIILTATGSPSAIITDANGNAGSSFPLVPGSFVYLPYGATIQVTYTTLTWNFFVL